MRAHDVNSRAGRLAGLECGDLESRSGIRVSIWHVLITLEKRHRMSALTLVRGLISLLDFIYMILASFSFAAEHVGGRRWRAGEVM